MNDQLGNFVPGYVSPEFGGGYGGGFLSSYGSRSDYEGGSGSGSGIWQPSDNPPIRTLTPIVPVTTTTPNVTATVPVSTATPTATTVNMPLPVAAANGDEQNGLQLVVFGLGAAVLGLILFSGKK